MLRVLLLKTKWNSLNSFIVNILDTSIANSGHLRLLNLFRQKLHSLFGSNVKLGDSGYFATSCGSQLAFFYTPPNKYNSSKPVLLLTHGWLQSYAPHRPLIPCYALAIYGA